METIGFVSIAIILLANGAYLIFSHRSLKNMMNAVDSRKTFDRFYLEHIVNSRTNFNIIYVAVTIATIALTFLGLNIQKNVIDETLKAVNNAMRVDISDLQRKALRISEIDSLAEAQLGAISKSAGQIRTILESARKFPQRFYIVHDLQISKQKKKFLWSELQTVDGIRIPVPTKRPVVFSNRYYPGYGSDYGGGIDVTAVPFFVMDDGIEFVVDDEPARIDLCIYFPL